MSTPLPSLAVVTGGLYGVTVTVTNKDTKDKPHTGTFHNMEQAQAFAWKSDTRTLYHLLNNWYDQQWYIVKNDKWENPVWIGKQRERLHKLRPLLMALHNPELTRDRAAFGVAVHIAPLWEEFKPAQRNKSMVQWLKVDLFLKLYTTQYKHITSPSYA